MRAFRQIMRRVHRHRANVVVCAAWHSSGAGLAGPRGAPQVYAVALRPITIRTISIPTATANPIALKAAKYVLGWRRDIETRLPEAADDGELPAESPVSELADELLAMLTGLQVIAALAPAETSPACEVAQYESFIGRVRC